MAGKWQDWWRNRRTNQQPVSGELGLELLEPRAMLSVSAFINPGSGQLTIYGDELANTIEVSRDAAGLLLINNGTVRVRGGVPSIANINRIFIHGAGGNDTLSLNEANGALPLAKIFGGSGDDTLSGGSNADQLFGQTGNDILLGRGGADLLFGGADHDLLTGGSGDDQVYGEAGEDRLIWNPGDGSDLDEGGTGIDIVEVQGGNGNEQFSVTANGTRVRFDRLDPAPFALDLGTVEQLAVEMNGGDDQFSATGNLNALIQISVDGGAGNDLILGSNGQDHLQGGEGNDFLDGQQGNDLLAGEHGDDLFQWDPGDGSDQIFGGEDTDKLVFNGSNVAETIEVSAVSGGFHLTRNIAAIVLDAAALEQIDLRTLGGADLVIANDLQGSGVSRFDVNLASQLGGASGDGQADQVVVRGTAGNDVIDVFGEGATLSVKGLSSLVTVSQSEVDFDTLLVEGGDGNDGLSAATVPVGIVKLTLDGGLGDDALIGSQAADLLLGGAGADFLEARRGDDVVFAGSENDRFQWSPGDGSDILEGQSGDDALLVFGSNSGETIGIAANGGRALFTRDIGNVALSLDDTERIEFRALGGADLITLGDLAGTDLTRVDLDLRGSDGAVDQAADVVTVTGTSAADTLQVFGDAGGVGVTGMQTAVNVFHAEAAIDRLTLNGMGGDDVLDASALEADGIQLSLLGGLGNDLLFGSAGNDLAVGGDGNDVALLGGGDDQFVWNPGDDNDVFEGQEGQDGLQFNGANIAETIGIVANGGRVSFLRDIANVALDLNDVESLSFRALGGADLIALGDLTGTGVTEVNLDLTAAAGGGDAQADSVVLSGANSDDVVVISGDGGSASVIGLAAQVNLLGCEPASDQLFLNLWDGDDVVEASGLTANVLRLTVDGGSGADVLIGSDGDDVLLGGEGDDVLLGGPGLDVLNGGLGDDIEIQ